MHDRAEGQPSERTSTSLTFLTTRLSGLSRRREGVALGLWGEAGIGKTHTALALLRVLSCRSVTLRADVPVSELARQLGHPAHLPAWAARVMERLQNGELMTTGDAMTAITATLVGLSPFVLHLEDLHDASAERVDLIGQLAQAVRKTRGVGLLVTSRVQLPDSFDSRHQEPLGVQAAAALLETEAGAVLPAEALNWIFDRAAGNPLFTLEYFRMLARLGHLWNDARRWHWRAPPNEPVPVTVEALIERALQDLLGSGALAEVAQARALLPAVTNAVWAAVAAVTPQMLTDIRRDLESRQVLRDGQFVHPLYREVLLKALHSIQRRDLARRALSVLHEDLEVAASLVELADLDPADAAALVERAAISARTAGRTLRAARLLAQAAGLAHGEAKARLALEAARALETISPPETLRLAKLAVQLHPDDEDAALYLAGRLVQRHRRLADADEVLARFPDSVRTGPAWLSWQITWMMSSGQYADALGVWEAHPELHDLSNPATLYSVAACLAQTGQFEQASVLAGRGLHMPEITPVQRASLLNVSSMACALMGQPEAAEAHLHAAITLAREHGLHQMLGALQQNRAKNLERTDQFAAALSAAQESFQAYGAAGDAQRQANAGVLVAGHLAEFGRYQEAETFLLDSLALLEQQGPSRFLVIAQTTLSALYRDWQPPHGPVLALKLAKSALAQARQLGPVSSITVFALASVARAEAATGQLEQAMHHAQEAVTASTQAYDESAFLACSALAAVQVARSQPEPARAAFQAALTAAENGGFTLDAQRLRIEMACLDRDVATARQLHGWFTTHGLHNGVHLTERAFPELLDTPDAADAAPRHAPVPQLEVLGVMRWTAAGDTRPVRGHKRQELLAALLETQLKGGSEVSRPELIDRLYPGADELQASASIKEHVRLIRASLGAGVIQTTPGGYALGTVISDAACFLQRGDTRLWRGAYLQGIALGNRDDSVSEALHLTLRSRAEALLTSDPQEAARVTRLLLEADPYAPEVLALTMQALRACGNHRSLQRVYHEARLRMAELGETLPEHWGDFLQASTL